MIVPRNSNRRKYGIVTMPTAPARGLKIILRCLHSVSPRPRCQRRRWRDSISNCSGTSVQHTGSGTNRIR
jgi:hypothetical protein